MSVNPFPLYTNCNKNVPPYYYGYKITCVTNRLFDGMLFGNIIAPFCFSLYIHKGIIMNIFSHHQQLSKLHSRVCSRCPARPVVCSLHARYPYTPSSAREIAWIWIQPNRKMEWRTNIIIISNWKAWKQWLGKLGGAHSFILSN